MKYVICLMILTLIACRGPRGDHGDLGSQGSVGNTGAPGSVGPQGPAGVNGTNGVNATPVTIVQFCPGTTSYPSEFNEIGFCINGNVYGTYSANDGFSTLLPPGTYNSNAIGSSCTFTIQANCHIQ